MSFTERFGMVTVFVAYTSRGHSFFDFRENLLLPNRISSLHMSKIAFSCFKKSIPSKTDVAEVTSWTVAVYTLLEMRKVNLWRDMMGSREPVTPKTKRRGLCNFLKNFGCISLRTAVGIHDTLAPVSRMHDICLSPTVIGMWLYAKALPCNWPICGTKLKSS